MDRRRHHNPERDRRIFELANKGFFVYDAVLMLISLILIFVFIRHQCVALMFFYYALFYAAQAGQHYLIFKFPLIDINKHYLLFRRLVIAICLVDGSYLFACVIFWQRTSAHPIYCGLHEYFGLGLWVGIILTMHFVFSLAWAISLIQSYINRRYYLLALGGFEVEQRIEAERRAMRENMMIREPNMGDFPIPRNSNDKYFKFEDAADVNLDNFECSICYNQDLQSHFVNAGCGHFYHQ